MRRFAILVVLLFAGQAAADWPSFHNDDANSGYVNQEISQPGRVVWEKQALAAPSDPNATATGAKIESSPVVANGLVVVTDWDGNIAVLDVETGQKKWTAKMARIVNTPVIEADRIFVVDTTGALNMFDIDTGDKLATASVGETRGSLTVHEGKVYIGNEKGVMSAFDTQTLTELWKFDTSKVYATSTWNNSTKKNECKDPHTARQIRGAPAVMQGKVFFGSFNHYAYAVEEEGNSDLTTNLAWSAKFEDIIWASPTVDQVNKRVIFAGYDGTVRSFTSGPSASSTNECNTTTHSPSWTFQIQSTISEGKIHSSPANDGTNVYFGTNSGHVFAIDARFGREQWQHKTGDSVFSSPSVAGKTLVVGSDDNHLYVLNATNGQELTKFDAGSAIKSSPAISDDSVFVTTFNGKTVRYGPPLAPRADLLAEIVKATPEELTIRVKNAGNKIAYNVDIEVHVDGRQVFGTRIPSLDPNGFHLYSEVPGDLGSTNVKAVLDPSDTIDESDETNNELVIPWTDASTPIPTGPPGNDSNPSPSPTGDAPLVDVPGPAPLLVAAGLALLAARRRK